MIYDTSDSSDDISNYATQYMFMLNDSAAISWANIQCHCKK